MLKSLLVSLGMSVFSLGLIAVLAKIADAYCCSLLLVKIGIIIIYMLVGFVGGKFVRIFSIKPAALPLLLFLGQIYVLGFIIDGHEGDTIIKTCITYIIIASSYGLAFVK